MEKKLNVGERIIISQILPKEGNFVTLKLIRDLQSKIGITADEHSEYEIVQENDIVRWNEKGKEEKSFDFKTKELEIISKELEKLDEDNKLNYQHFSIFEKFIGE